MGTTSGEVHIVVLTDPRFEYFVKPVGVGVILEMVFSGLAVKFVSRWQRSVGVCSRLTEVLAVLVSIHYIIDILRNIIHTEVSIVIHFQRLVFLSAFGGDNNHTISSARTVDGSSRSILQHLDGFNIV